MYRSYFTLRMFICSLSLMLLMSMGNFANAQLNKGGTPLSFQLHDKIIQKDVPIIQMQSFDLAAVRAEDRLQDFQPATPFRFGYNMDVQINPDNSGVWEVEEGKFRLWRVGIESPGARSLNLLFDKYELPEGARLFVYSADKKELIGAFSHLNNQEDGFFATTLVFSDNIVVEYFEPYDASFRGELNISRVTHGYRAYGEVDKSFGASGSCNLNVACEAADDWQEQVRSAARMVVNGNSWCSGQLVNNTSNDGKPYFLSANHCYTNPGQVVFWFNYQSETCQNPSSPPSHDALSGAVDVSRNAASDFWLMELNQEPPAEYDVYFSGWNRTMDPSIDGYIFGVHHPRGDIKKFSYLFDGVTTSSYLGATGSGTTHWRVGTWADGTTTEPGSSGSALFDGNGNIIGQLHGGYAACGNTLEDWYGKLGVSWTGGGTPTTRLSEWLDPAGLGVESWPGFDPQTGVVDVDAAISSIISPSGIYGPDTEIVPEVIIRNSGILPLTSATVSYSVDDGPSQSIEWTGNLETAETEVVSFNGFMLPSGDYTFTANISADGDENPNNDSRTINFRVVDCNAPTRLPFTEDFDFAAEIPDCWEVVDNVGNGQVWRVGTIGDRGVSGTSGNYAYLDSDAFGSGNQQDSDLITPVLDLSNYENIEVSFTHFFRQFQSSEASFAYSIDAGESWETVESWTETTPNPSTFSQSFPELAGEDQVRFKWKFTGSWDWYWSFDDVEITGDQVEPFPASVQLVHNSADPLLGSVDVFVNGELFMSEITFPSSVHIAEVPAGEAEIGFAQHGSDEIAYTQMLELTEDGNYLMIVSGVLDSADFMPNPDGASTALVINTFAYPQHAGSDDLSLYLYHGVTDLPSVDLYHVGSTETLVEQLGYGMKSMNPILLSPDAHTFELVFSSGEVFATFDADFSMESNKMIGLYLSGFLSPSGNMDGDEITVLGIMDDDSVIELNLISSNTGDGSQQLPREFALKQNYPNPFNPVTVIEYALPEPGQVTLEVFNLMGQRVATLVNGSEAAGQYSVTFDASRLSSGMYIYRLQSGSFVQTKKMMLVK
ncbi:MAG: T9SS type A sorting domain-containing protein [Balneolales bacterium]|nr:T9SS type A sorting domain-containing protein [Balneolales bacterium]